MNAEVIRIGIVDIQVCVPEDWTDAQIVAFANEQQPTEESWKIRTDPKWLQDCPSRNRCQSRIGFVHVTLDVLMAFV